jgi:MFS family permease
MLIFTLAAVLFWGIIATVQAAASSWGGLMACRALLGIAEAMFGPGVPLYLSYFYPRSRVGFRHGVFISGSALANAYGSTLAYGITQIKGSLGPWRILFLIEGLPTILLAVWTFFYLPDSIMAAKFLNDREKEIAKHMVGRNQILEEGEEKKGANFKDYLAAFLDPKGMILSLSHYREDF